MRERGYCLSTKFNVIKLKKGKETYTYRGEKLTGRGGGQISPLN